MKKKNYEIIICGAGMVGLTLSLLLARKKIHVCVLEKNIKKDLFSQIDSRTTAISQGSSRIHKEIGIWEKIQSKAQPINKIFVSDGKEDQNLEFNHQTLCEGPLGFIIENKLIKHTLLDEVLNSKYIDFLDSSEISEIDNKDTNNSFVKTNDSKISYDLLIAADGRFSKTRFHASIKYFFHDYKQEAFVFNISHVKKHNGVALERFFPTGPMALLPMKSDKTNMSSVVWTVDSRVSRSKSFKENFENEFAKKYNKFFGELKSISKVNTYPLSIYSCYDYSKKNIVLVGDACQAIHPIAGQGFNLGLRDVNCLSEMIYEFKQVGLEPQSSELLKKYEKKRIIDKNLLITATHGLNGLFSSSKGFRTIFRKIGLKVFSKSTFLKNQSMLFAMGLRNLEI